MYKTKFARTKVLINTHRPQFATPHPPKMGVVGGVKIGKLIGAFWPGGGGAFL